MPDLPRLTLVLGGAASGKSLHAERLVVAQPPPWTYIATATAGDGEMADRIARHRQRRGAGWTLVEAPTDLAGAVRHAPLGVPILIDCLTLWLSATTFDAPAADVDAAFTTLEAALKAAPAPVVAVSNEVGLSIVPDTALARAFRDAHGALNQRIAALADAVIFVAAGLPLTLKSGGRIT